MRDAICALACDLDRLAATALSTARVHALEAIDGNEIEARKAKHAQGAGIAYTQAMNMVDRLRVRLEQGEFKIE